MRTVIHITCTACDLHWDRMTAPNCETCGSRDMVCVPEVLVERSRGTQLSITGVQPHYKCRSCDADELTQPRAGATSPTPLAGTASPTVSDPRPGMRSAMRRLP